MVERIDERYGLDDPIPVQFVDYWERTIQWDLGESFLNRRSVNEILGERAVNSLRLGIWAIIIEIIVGISVGLLSALRRYSLADRLTTIVTAAASAIPVFVLGLPPAVRCSPCYPNKHDWPEWAQLRTQGLGPDTWTLFFIPTGEQWRYLILPAITLASRVHRARRPHDPRLDARGAAGRLHAHGPGQGPRPSGRSCCSHGLRNAMLPVVTLIGIDFGTVIGAAVLTETVFSWPGLGSEIANSVAERDLPVLLGLTLVVVLAYAFINLLVDLSYAWFDPRIRLGKGAELMTHRRPGAPPRSPSRPAAEGGDADLGDGPPAARPTSGGASGRNRLAMVGLVFIVLLVLVALFAPLIAPYDLTERTSEFRQGPSRDHWFGTDAIGRDVFSRVVYGARVSLRIGVIATAIVADHRAARSAPSPASSAARSTPSSCGSPTCSWPSPTSSWPSPSPRSSGASENAVILVLGLTGWLAIARIVRASFLSLKQLEYVEAATALGFSTWPDHVPAHPAQRPAADHRLRHDRRRQRRSWPRRRCRSSASGRSRPDAGVGPDGRRGQGRRSPTRRTCCSSRARAIFLTVLAFVFVGDGLRDALDPKLK